MSSKQKPIMQQMLYLQHEIIWNWAKIRNLIDKEASNKTTVNQPIKNKLK